LCVISVVLAEGNGFKNRGGYLVMMIGELIKKNEDYRCSGLNLIASENRASKNVLDALSSDLGGRYGDEWYGGSRYACEICMEVEILAKKVFKARHVFITPLSGNLCDLAILFSFTHPGDTIAGIAKEDGGYPLGYEKFQRKLLPIPTQNYLIDVPVAKKKIIGVPLTILGSSVIPFPHPVKEFTSSQFGILAYDGSHVLGLIAGGEFQDPFGEGADIVMGSTHKSFPGPQGGIVMTNSWEKAQILQKMLCFDFEEGIGLVDNPHLHRIAALGVALQEMRDHGKTYARQIIRNAQALAQGLAGRGVPLRLSELGYTRSHQLLLNLSSDDAKRLCHSLEKLKIFIDISGRIGVAEVTHAGMKEKEMEKIAQLIGSIVHGKGTSETAREVEKLAVSFNQ
jgi:glycine hydroxymethyltransferase